MRIVVTSIYTDDKYKDGSAQAPGSSAATTAYAIAAAAPPTKSVEIAPHAYVPIPWPAPVMWLLTRPKRRSTMPVRIEEYIKAVCARAMKK